jgi:hypothetical protein
MNMKNVIILFVAIVLIGVFGYVILFTDNADNNNDTVSLQELSIIENEPEPTVPETKLVVEGWRGYQNKSFRFGLLYPQELNVREYKEAGGAMSATFENPKTGKGFQIYVTPYADTEITKERLQLDLPSGVVLEPTYIVVDEVSATMFFSTNSIMGETREVWFIKNGFLYEIVTYKQLDNWLGTIMQTWKFL